MSLSRYIDEMCTLRENICAFQTRLFRNIGRGKKTRSVTAEIFQKMRDQNFQNEIISRGMSKHPQISGGGNIHIHSGYVLSSQLFNGVPFDDKNV